MRSNVTKSSVNVAFGTNRSFARTRIAKSLCAFILRQSRWRDRPTIQWRMRGGST